MQKPYAMPKQKRKFWIVLNMLSILLILSLYYYGKYDNWPVWAIVCGIISILLFVISFIKGYLSTGLWKLSHMSDKSLDERQLQVALNALRYSYTAFTVITLIIIYGFALAEKGPIDVVIAACLLYLAHILPASIMGWTEKII